MSGVTGTFLTRWTAETAHRGPESGGVSDTCGSQCHSGSRMSVFHKQSKSRHLSQTEKNNQSLQLLWLPQSQAQGMECPPYILRKIQTVKNWLSSWKDRQKKKQLGSHHYLWRDIYHYHAVTVDEQRSYRSFHLMVAGTSNRRTEYHKLKGNGNFH